MSARRGGRARNRRGEGAQLRTELLAAADDLLERTGDPSKVTVRGVATAVGVAPNAVYLHFADRDDLLAELARRAFADSAAAVERAVEGIDAPLARLRAGHAAYCAHAVARPGHYRLLFGGHLASASPRDVGRVADAGAAFFAVLVDACAACIDAGELHAESPERLASAIWSLEHGWCDLSITGMGDLLPDPVEALDLLLGAGAGAGAGGAGRARRRRRAVARR